MLTEPHDRRRLLRRAPDPGHALSRVRLRTGRELAVVDITAAAVRVAGTTRLLPNTHVDVHVTTAQGRMLVRARVVRCAVTEVASDHVQYQAALAFATSLELAPDSLLNAGGGEAATAGKDYGPGG